MGRPLRGGVREMLAVAGAALLGGCAVPHPCDAHRSDLTGKARLIAHFQSETAPAGQTRWTVLRSRRVAGPPVVLLPELPAVSSSLLELGKRIEARGYTVYVPVMWGAAMDDASDRGLVKRRFAALSFCPPFYAAHGNAHRQASEDLAAFCRDYVLPRHPGQRLGMVGNCLTGSFPFAVAGTIPQLTAPVGSQPAIPTMALTPAGKKHPGLNPRELAALDGRAMRREFQMLAFRFAGDGVSPGARFETMRKRFSGHFIGYELPVALYVTHDELPAGAHTVLTGCYGDGQFVSTQFAWEELCRFLEVKLKGRTKEMFTRNPDPIR